MRVAPALAVAAAAAVVATTAYGRGSVRSVPPGFHPETAAGVGTRDYWVLGDYRCGRTWCSALVRSTDGGKQFRRVALPPIPSPEATPSLTFANARVGYVAVPGGRLYATRDGGTSWHPWGPPNLRDVTVAGGEVYGLLRNRLERSPLSRSAWREVPIPVHLRFLVSLAARGRRVWLLGSTRNVRAGDVTLRSADHGTTFAKSHGPCIPELAGRLVPASSGVVWAVCPTGMMAGLSLSTNGGRTFPRFGSFHHPGGVGLPSLTNGAGVFPISGRAAVLYEGAQGPLFRTEDTGRRWSRVRRTARIAQVLWLGFTTSRAGAAVVTTRSHATRPELWRTTDGGETWHSVPIR